jgi:hypothetical protein
VPKFLPDLRISEIQKLVEQLVDEDEVVLDVLFADLPEVSLVAKFRSFFYFVTDATDK